jgi:hypothetical protein
MKTVHLRRQAMALALGACILASGWTADQALGAPADVEAAEKAVSGATEEPARRRSILRRNRRTEAESSAAAAAGRASEAPPYQGDSEAAPATDAAPLPRFPEQPATYTAPVGRPYLGVTFDLRYPSAAVVQSVAPGGPAAQSGLRPGDAIHAINKRAVATWQDVIAVVQSLRPGDQLDVSYSRRVEGQTQVVLSGRQPDGPQTASYVDPATAVTPKPNTLPTPGPADARAPSPEPASAAPDAARLQPQPAADLPAPADRHKAADGQDDQDRNQRPGRVRSLLRRRN